MNKPIKYVLGSIVVAFLCTIMPINVDAETEDQAFEVFSDVYQHEPFWLDRYNTDTIFDKSNHGSAVYYECDNDEIGIVGNTGTNINVIQKIKGSGVYQAGQDYGSMVATSHKFYINSMTATGYTITLSTDYIISYWQISGQIVCRSYYKIVGYDSSDNIVSQSSLTYVARYDTIGGYYTQPNSDGGIHSGGSTSYTIIGPTSSVSYIKIVFVTEGSYLYSTDGIEIKYTNIDVKYSLFAGSQITKGDSSVSATVTYPADKYVTLELKNGANNGLDYGSVRAWTPYLYFNNAHASMKNTVGDFEIDFTRDYWNGGSMSFQGYYKIYYYDSSRSSLGTDTYQWIDYDNTINPPKTTVPASSGTITIPSPSSYNAKFIKVEVSLAGSCLYASDGAKFTFSNLKIAGARAYNTEVLYYYESDYDSNDITDIINTQIRYELINNHNSHGFIFRNEIDDTVDSSDFTGTNNDDVRANDFFIFTGHGGNSLTETYMSLTNNQNIDDDDIGDFGDETEIVFLYCCRVLGTDQLGNQQRGEWKVHGLKYNHGILGFTGDCWWDYDAFVDFFDNLLNGWTFASSFEDAFSGQPWASIWDASWQANSDYLWDISSSSLGWSSDESPDDGNYYERLKP